jgi:penicillin G amidase
MVLPTNQETSFMTHITEADLAATLPDVTSTQTLSGLDGPVTIVRDALGIPHIQATTTHDAFYGQGFAVAQDRLWQMDFDRFKAYGRSAEVLGAGAVEADTLIRRMRFEANARADYAAVNDRTRSMLDAYAAGVNAFIDSTASPAIEYRLLDLKPEPWRAFDCLAVARIRHVFMGNFEFKLWRAKLLAQVGPELTAKLFPSSDPGGLVIIPPDSEFEGFEHDGREILDASDDLTRLMTGVDSDTGDAGSNSWALAGSRTATGKPILAGDPHRGPDTPNVYVQNHVTCPDFDAVGLSFAGLPSFIHFGHSAHVAWCVTHASADYQDLYVERLTPGDPPTYEFEGAQHPTTIVREAINVRGAAPVEIDVVSTHHGSVIMGSPEQGVGLALRYSATAEPSTWAESLLDMLYAKDVDEFEEAMRPWVDPCNNMMCADLNGNISYQMRGKVPIRSLHNAWVPVPGWDGEHEWNGLVPFEETPRLRNPENGFIVTANNRIMSAAYPHYLSMDYWPDFRGRRVVERLRDLHGATVDDMASIHAERTSILAKQLLPSLVSLTPTSDLARQAIDLLRVWDCSMDADKVQPTIYSALFTELFRLVSTSLVGDKLTAEAMNGMDRGGPAHLRGMRVIFARAIEAGDNSLLPDGETWDSLLARSLDDAIAWLRATFGDDIQGWTWGTLHRTQHTHVLMPVAADYAALLNPPSVECGGDSDTPQQGAFAPGKPFTVYSTSVARYVYDLADWNNSWWVVPLGSSGHPGSPHYADQMRNWADVGMYPMLYDWDRIRADAESTQELRPA